MAAPTIYRLDPKADTIIVLKDPNGEFAPYVPPNRLAHRIDDSSEDATTEDEEMGKRNLSAGEVHYYVSSSLLRLGSPVFSASLSADRTKGRPSPADLFRYIINEEMPWDEDAFLILLNIIHAHPQVVTLSLEMLAKIAVLIDYYDCKKVAELVSETWVDEVKSRHPVPNRLNRALMLWMCVAWVLKLPLEFKSATKVAISKSIVEELPTLNLPIAPVVAKRINSTRENGIRLFFQELNQVGADFVNEGYQCPHSGTNSSTCGSMLYGALERLRTKNILYKYSRRPFKGFCIWRLEKLIVYYQYPVWRNDVASPDGQYERHECLADKPFMKILGPLRALEGINGLDLDDFPRRR